MPAKTEWIVSTLLQERGPISWQEHRTIVDAVASGEAELAEQVTRHHSDTVIGVLRTR